MKNAMPTFPALALLLTVLSCVAAQPEHHRATRLGSPATRFAPPLTTPDDLRALFRDEKLKPDFAAVLQQWGWPGNLEDLFQASLTADISDHSIPVGTTMPFMSSRRGGRPVCLRNVLWAGQAPAPAYSFDFTSRGRCYRCVTPKACSNFFVEDLGPEPQYALAIDCSAPDQVLHGRPVEVCLTVRNTGNIVAPQATIALPIPEGAVFVSATGGGVVTAGKVKWEIANLASNATEKVCAVVKLPQPGKLSFTPIASSTNVNPVQCACETKVVGLPAILIDAVDLEDPVEVGNQVTYDIKVTNQGTAAGTQVRLVCTLPASQEFVSGSGATPVQAQDRTVTTEPLATLAPKDAASWRVVVKVLKAEDARFKVELTSDQFTIPIHEEESTHQY